LSKKFPRSEFPPARHWERLQERDGNPIQVAQVREQEREQAQKPVSVGAAPFRRVFPVWGSPLARALTPRVLAEMAKARGAEGALAILADRLGD
jgi:hypothetical protein